MAREHTEGAHSLDVFSGAHRAAACPALIANAQKLDPIRRLVAVRDPLLAERTRLRCGHVFQPLRRFLRCARANIHIDIGLGADLIDEVHELVSTEAVRLKRAAPIGIDGGHAP